MHVLKTGPNNIELNGCSPRILRQLLYYDIFDHPLSEEELCKDCSVPTHDKPCFRELLDNRLTYRLNGYYALRNEPHLAEKRDRGLKNTGRAMPVAMKMGRLISRFPFIRAVALSGSISKGYMDTFKDVDFFIIARPNRLWLARTLLVIYKKIFLLNSFRFFCLNYFIDENNLKISERNIFTATEINTMIPVYGFGLIDSFYRSNEWVREYYKDFPQKELPHEVKPEEGAAKKVMERLLTILGGNWLDLLAMKFTVWYWRRKYRNNKRNLLEKSFRLSRSEAKYHPGDFQNKVMEEFRKRLSSFEKEKNVTLSDEA